MAKIRPQEGFQTDFVTCRADILIAGSAAGVGKTFGLLLDPLRHINVNGWGAVIFRRTTPQIKSEGGLWDGSMKIYPYAGGQPKESISAWEFPNGTKFKFSHLEYEKNVLDWQGAEIPYIGFDELPHFTEKMFTYLLSRNRSTCGIRPRVRATCNPDPDSWVVDWIDWWIGEDGFPIIERCGKLRYLIVDGGNKVWGATKEEVIEKASYLIKPIVEESDGLVTADDLVKSITFIPGSIYQNKKLLEVNPSYLANLLSQDDATRLSLLDGNWKAKPNDDDLLDYYKFQDSVYSIEPILTGKKYITADVALEGSDKMIVGAWDDWTLIDIDVIPKSDGKEALEAIQRMQNKHQIRNSNVAYDNDGVGGYIKGFIKGAIQFKNGSRAMKGENYQNLKTQCYYLFAKMVNSEMFSIVKEVANTSYDKNETVAKRMIKERKAIKKFKADHDGKMRIIPKEQMKVLLSGTSPDILDMCMMRGIFEYKQRKGIKVR